MTFYTFMPLHGALHDSMYMSVMAYAIMCTRKEGRRRHIDLDEVPAPMVWANVGNRADDPISCGASLHVMSMISISSVEETPSTKI